MLNRTRIALAALAIVALGGLARSEYSPIRGIMGPNSSGSGNVACWGDIFGLSLTDCGAFPVANVGNVATNAALKALTGGLYSTVIRTGYNAANDVPGAAYAWNAGSSCTDDGGSCIQPNVGSGRWILVPPNGPIPAGIFGAVCINSGNDQPALQAALNYAQSASSAGRTLHISGNCILNAALVATSNVTIEGDGMNSTFLQPSSTANICINFNPAGANKTVNIRHLTCTYASLTSSGVAGLQYGNTSFNNIGGQIEWFDCTNCSTGISLLNAINVVVSHVTVSPFYFDGIGVSNPLAPDSGGNVIHDSYIQVFAPLTAGSIGIHWLSGGAFDLHDNQIFAPTPVVLNEQLQTSELHVHHNLIVGAGATPTAGVQLIATSAAFTCTQSTTNMTVTAVTGTIATAGPASLGQTVSGAGVAAGTTIVSQTSGTPGGAGVYVTSASGTAAAAACLSTFQMTELIIDGNIFDGTVRPIYVPQNIGGEFNYNMIVSNNTISSDSNSSTNQITVFNTSGFTLSGNLIKCNGNCAGGRPIAVDSSSSKGLIVQGASTEIGSWGAADSIASSTTTIAATFGGQTKVCTVLPTVANGIITAC